LFHEWVHLTPQEINASNEDYGGLRARVDSADMEGTMRHMDDSYPRFYI
jgi:hypothetical protein